MEIEKISQFIKEANEIVIVAHKSPDGDSIGSSLAMYHYLKCIGKNVTICHPDKAPSFLHWMPGFSAIVTLEENEFECLERIKEADLIICLDFNSPTRVGKLEESLKNTPGKKIMIDHHLNPELEFFEAYISRPEVCSTAQLVYEYVEKNEDLNAVDLNFAICVYTGIMTDTGSFRFSSVSPKTHKIAAALLEMGLDQSVIHENVNDQNTINQIQLTSFALLEKLVFLKDLKIAYLGLTSEELARFNAYKGDTEGLVNMILGVQGVKMAVFLKEDGDIVKMSFRSKGKIPVNTLASDYFTGGGHLNAAGGKYVGKLDTAIEKLVTLLPNFVNTNKALFE